MCPPTTKASPPNLFFSTGAASVAASAWRTRSARSSSWAIEHTPGAEIEYGDIRRARRFAGSRSLTLWGVGWGSATGI